MLPRKSDKLENAVTNWIHDIKVLEEIFHKKTSIIPEYVERIIDLNKNKDEKIFLMNGLEDAVYVVENETCEKLDFILEEILGNELEENKEISKMLKYLKEFRDMVNDIKISIKNFLKAYNMNIKNQKLLSEFIIDIKNKISEYKNKITIMNKSFSKIRDYLNTQKRVSQQVDII